MSLSQQVSKQLLDHLFMKTAFTQLTNIYVSAHTGDPGDDGQTANEVSGNGYAAVSTAGADWEASSAGSPSTIQNLNAVQFPAADGGSWGLITHFGLWKHATNRTAADFVGGGALSASKQIDDTDILRFPAGNLDATLE